MERAAEMALRTDLVIALGSTLGVYPAASTGCSRPPVGQPAPRADGLAPSLDQPASLRLRRRRSDNQVDVPLGARCCND